MRTRYRHDLDSVREMSNELMELVILCYDKIDLYLENHNKKNLEEIIELNDDIRRNAADVERFCFELLALQQPVARDLRFLQMSIKLASTYKRISSHLAQASMIMIEYSLTDKEVDFVKRFIDNEKQMAEDSIHSFVNNDNDLGLKTIEDDEINNKLFEEAITYIADQNKMNEISAMELSEKVLLYKYFERLGDRLARVGDLATRL
ncbi:MULTISPECIES: PhoU domain-containing protein [Anaerococcus]|jgi:hypothetical protein|uniref:Phosphate uptake regulator PhoU n=1 Tax=Anaerococcus nagyae TaxID=1755241 RepID=A0A3E2THA5_9FIRM|nr:MULTISPECIES: PhoU domain-containing protein [Anaerococcus]MBP2069854.1 phosphate transport system protein [Anaerococcus nagyae]MDU1829418.1 PhoU domain-containing protein [Anaerococcus sp.]MDU1863754.1 PhoU domain-containing protein [Anaerococcus sp.]MDU2354302.1 PhoU domain-containing protein [Anaerococcus sp.]MDU2565712.1 PhoU domain-containing protein [Anaerococcus sp.]